MLSAIVFIIGAVTMCMSCATDQTSDRPSTGPEAELSAVEGDLTVFAAASLEPAFVQLAESFHEQHPQVTVAFSFDGSSGLATQILAGAPVDVFASADEPNMLRVTNEGMNQGEPISFATSELAIAVAPGNPFGVEDLSDLTRPGPDGTVPITVICAPEVPCGNASQTLLERQRVELTPASEEQNVTAVLTKVREGEADAGLVYLSDILRAEGEVEGLIIENAADAAGDYLIVPIAGTTHRTAAGAFSEFMTTAEAQSILAELGFGPAR